MSVITISREAGSLGDEIAGIFSEKHSFELLDSESIKDLLSSNGIEKPVIDQFDEKNPGFFSHFSEKREKFLNYLTLSVFEAGLKGDLAVLGLGGPFLFNSQSGVVRIRITSPLDVRIARVAAKYDCEESYAKKLIHHVDHDRAGFHKAFFGKEINDNEIYDLVINSDFISADNAVKLIKDVCGFKKNLPFNFENNYISHKAVISILYEKRIPVKNLLISFNDGVITLDGNTKSNENVELCTLAVKEIEKVEEVHNRISHKALNNYSIH